MDSACSQAMIDPSRRARRTSRVAAAAASAPGRQGGCVHGDQPGAEPRRRLRGQCRPARSWRSDELDLDRQPGFAAQAKRVKESGDLGHRGGPQHRLRRRLDELPGGARRPPGVAAHESRQQQRVSPPARRPGEGVAAGQRRRGEQPSHERGIRARRQISRQVKQGGRERWRRVGGVRCRRAGTRIRGQSTGRRRQPWPA